MNKGELLTGEAVLCALYLRGSPFRVSVERRSWPLVVETLMNERPLIGAVGDILRKRGRYGEAACLTPAALDWGLDLVTRSRALTFLDERYPRGWVGALGSGAPPCVWTIGALPTAPGVAVVGSREPSRGGLSFTVDAVQRLLSAGATIVSGGAVGVDSAVARAVLAAGDSGRCVVLLPYGLDNAVESDATCLVSVCEPWARFTTGQAMERNALAYSYGRRAVVVEPRLRQGGSWHGAVDALRRGLAHVWVHGGGKGSAGLIALGAEPILSAHEAEDVMGARTIGAQPDLFGARTVRESVLGARGWLCGGA